MKFREIYGVCWGILIEEEWYYLCVCINCGEVHAGNIGIADEKIKCCEKPDNWRHSSKNNSIEKRIKEFVNKWSD
uniref:Uncharacterized protein n=1 Tax=viral metagenome TaxID=1070528 RepID=A0A6H1ZQ05_9ZZZZ